MSRITDLKNKAYQKSYAALSYSWFQNSLIFALAITALPFLAEYAFAAEQDSLEISEIDKRSNSILPIVMYDSDIGFGLGVKGVFKNRFNKKESFDLLIFGSTKGEQNYALCFSIPDTEIRQGIKYPISLDLKLEFYKLLKSNFFGIGNSTDNNDYQFPRESFNVSLVLCRAISNQIIAGIGSMFTHYSVYDYDFRWQTISDQTLGTGENDLSIISAFLRYDTRDSFINPGRGIKTEFTIEKSAELMNGDWDFTKNRLEFNLYHHIFSRRHILAYRFWLEQIIGSAPYQELSKIGDGWTARGYKADRFLDNSMALITAEYRLPLYGKLGGVAFFDNGRVWSGLNKINFANWHGNVGAGLRLYLENFVTRFDIGHSIEGTRLFINFGHVF